MSRERDPLDGELALLRRRQAHLEAAAEGGTGESAEGWSLAQAAFTRLEAGLRTNPPTTQSLAAIDRAVGDLRRLLREGASAGAIYEEIYRNTDAIRRLVATARRHASPEEQYHDRQAFFEARQAEVTAILGLGAPRPKAPRRRSPKAPPAGPQEPPGPAPVR